MRLEILYPELANLYGEIGDMKLLQSLGLACTQTFLGTKPSFLEEPKSLVFMGPMSEKAQRQVLAELLPHKEDIKELVEAGTIFLFVGNALEIMGQRIITPEGENLEGLGIFPYYATQNYAKRRSSKFLGSFTEAEGKSPIEIVGFRSQFSSLYELGAENALFRVEKGEGSEIGSKYEGYRKNNFFGTYIIGPLLISNPLFLRFLLNKIDQGLVIPEEELMLEAYFQRLKEFKIR